MSKHNTGVNKSAGQHKDNTHHARKQAFFQYLQSNVATCTMVAVALNIYRPSACRYKRWLQQDGHLYEIGKGICAITGFPAKYLTTDESKKPVQPQLNLFDHG